MGSSNTVVSSLSKCSKPHGPWVNSVHPQGARKALAHVEVKKLDLGSTSGLLALEDSGLSLATICLSPLISIASTLQGGSRQKVGLCKAFVLVISTTDPVDRNELSRAKTSYETTLSKQGLPLTRLCRSLSCPGRRL